MFARPNHWRPPQRPPMGAMDTTAALPPLPILCDREQLALLAEAGAAFSEELEPSVIFDRLADLTVPTLSDLCTVVAMDSEAVLTPMAASYSDSSLSDLLRATERRFPPRLDHHPFFARAIILGTPIIIAHVSQDDLTAMAYTPEHRELLDRFAPRSMLIAPLLARGRTLGVLTLAMGPSGRSYSRADLALAGDLAHRAALALDNARLYAAVRDANVDLEERIAERTTALRRSEERYRIVAETARDAIITADQGGVISFANPAAETVFGYTPPELVGQPLDMIIPPDRQAPPQIHASSDADWAPASPTPPSLRTGLHKRGHLIPLEISQSSAAEHGQCSSTYVIRDVSERQQLEEQLRQALKMEAIGRLAGGVAHDFNNVLTAISGYGELIAADLAAGIQPQPTDVEQILSAARRAARLTQQLLAFSRKQVLQPKVLSLNGVISEIEPMLRRLIGEDVLLKTDLDPEPGLIEVDPGQIQQVLLNLAVNARDAMPSGGTLTLGSSRLPDHEPPQVALVVRDTGTGMDEVTQQHIFEPFYTTKERGKGTGLGLSTVYGIVTQSGGTIAVESSPGCGSTFTIRLPEVQQRQPAAEAPRPPEAHVGGETLLLVEDDAAVRELLAATLRQIGYTVLAAEDGQAALERYTSWEGPLDMLVTDVIMPGLSGPDLARQLRRHHAGLLVLFISGYTDDSIGVHGLLGPGIAFLQKPFGVDDLAHKVRGILDSPAPHVEPGAGTPGPA